MSRSMTEPLHQWRMMKYLHQCVQTQRSPSDKIYYVWKWPFLVHCCNLVSAAYYILKEERIGPSNEWFHSFSLVQILMGCSVLCYWNINKNQCHKATALICNRSTERLNFMIQWKAQLALCSFSLGLKPQKYTIKENIIKLPIIWNGEYRIWLSTVGHKTNRKAPH